MTVLILARDIDPHVDRVVEELLSRDVPVFRTDLAAFPRSLMLDFRLGVDGWHGGLANEYRSVRFSDIRSVWYRHPSHFAFPEEMSSTERRHAAAEAKCAFGGALSRLKALWVNYPSREADAVKPAQLCVARECGLKVPRSLMTNRSDAVREFAKEVGGPVAVKNLSSAAIAESGGVQIAFTRRLDPSDLDDLRGVETTAHLFQEFIEPKAYEARITVVGERIFTSAIHAHSDTSKIDFRSDYDNLTYSVVEPPKQVTAGILAFMRTFGLVFGAFDFAVTPLGEWIMFECNPFGAYGWLEHELGLPISASVADLLARGVDDAVAADALEALRDLYEDVGRREARLAGLGAKKVTRRLAERHPDLRPRVALFSECHELFSTGRGRARPVAAPRPGLAALPHPHRGRVA